MRSIPGLKSKTASQAFTLLIVEDDASLRNLLERYLTQMAYSVIAESNACAALETLEQHRDQIALIMTDVSLPGMDGYQLLEKVRQDYPHIPVIFMTGLGGDPDSPNDDLQPDALLKKPISLAEIKIAIEEILLK
ncbi:response regulator [bacterium]|nr:response regulator [bacterium]MBU1653089.1 response regulator [bacterium]